MNLLVQYNKASAHVECFHLTWDNQFGMLDFIWQGKIILNTIINKLSVQKSNIFGMFIISSCLTKSTQNYTTKHGGRECIFHISHKQQALFPKRWPNSTWMEKCFWVFYLYMLYKALILPHLDYCDAVWGNAGKTQLKILDRLQNAAGKIILGLPRRYPTEILLNTLRWDKLENRRNLYLNILVYKSLTNTLPSPCAIFFFR